MDIFFSHQITPWVVLTLSFFLLFYRANCWPMGFILSVLTAYMYDVINFVGCVFVSASLMIAYSSYALPYRSIRYFLRITTMVVCLALAAHIAPGFNNLLVLDDVKKSEISQSFSLYFNIDKPMIIFLLLAAFPTLLNMRTPVAVCPRLINLSTGKAVLLVSAFILIILCLANILGLIQFDVGLPSWWFVFALNNLLLTCVIEECFFRGVIQAKLQDYLACYVKPQQSACYALLFSSVIFGLAHFAGGTIYVLVATLAGVLYGLVYQATGRLIYAIATHFLLNFMHLAFFTYPLAIV